MQTAKSEAQSNGAADVGALDSDDFSGLDGGKYVIYAGVFDSRKQAKRALKKLKKDFAGAKVIQVSAGGGVSARGDPDALSGKKKAAKVGKASSRTSRGSRRRSTRRRPRSCRTRRSCRARRRQRTKGAGRRRAEER